MDDIQIAAKFVAKAKSSSDRNIPFMLSFSEYKRLLKTKKCYYTGVELTFEKNQPNSFTIDRIDADRGYVPGNCVACSNIINQKKKDLSLSDMRCIFRKIKRRL